MSNLIVITEVTMVRKTYAVTPSGLMNMIDCHSATIKKTKPAADMHESLSPERLQAIENGIEHAISL